MPPFLFAIPAAVLLAWLASKGGRARAPKRTPEGMAGGALEGGDTQRLRGSAREDDPWKRDELPFASGGEVGGMYGPTSNPDGPPSSPSGYEDSPGPTQTTLLSGGDAQSQTWAFGASSPAQVFGPSAPPVFHPPPVSAPPSVYHPPPSAPAPVYHGGMVPRPPTPTVYVPPPMPAGRYE